MPVLKRRPRIALVAPRTIETGGEVELRALLDCAAPVPVRGIELDVIGRAVWMTHSQYGDQRNASDFHRAGATLFAGGELPPGRQSLAARVRLPAGLPGSYRGRRIHVEYVARIAVDIPWWPDAVEVFELHVADGGPARGGRPAIAESSPEGPVGRAPYLELSVPTTELAPGSRLELAASLGNVEHNRYRRLELELVAVETATGFLAGGTSERSASRWVVDLERLREGAPVRTRIGLPDDLVPAFDLERIRLRWILRARARVAWSRDVVVELPVSVRAARARPLEVRAPPEVGSGRVAGLWREVGDELGLALADGVLSGAVGRARIAVWRELSGRSGPLLTGEIELPDLRIGLRLDGRRRSPAARDRRQGELLARRLAGAFREAGAVTADDRRVRCTSRASGARRAPLASFVRAVLALARGLEETCAALPPPAGVDLDPWNAAAAALRADLEPAGPGLRGEREGIAWSLGLIWSDGGEPEAIGVELAAPALIDRRHHLRWAEWDPRPTDEAVAALCDDARSLEIDRAALRARYAREAGPAHAAARLPTLVALVRALCGPPATGAYR